MEALSAAGGEIPAVAFANPDGSIAAVLLNQGVEDRQLRVALEGASLTVELPSRSIRTIVFRSPE